MGIHKLAEVSPNATLGKNVDVGPFTIVYDNVEIGANSTIGSHCAIGVETPLAQGRPLTIGEDSTIRSHSVFYEGSTFGRSLRTGHHVNVRENLKAGVDLQIGTLADLQGKATIGDHVRIYNAAHIAQETTIGNFVWIFPFVVFTNDPTPPSDGFLTGITVEDFAVIASGSTVLPGVTIGRDSLVGAHSLVSSDIAPEVFATGVPARKVAMARHVPLRDGSGPAYPWRKHFHRGFPDQIVDGWMTDLGTPGPE